MVLHFNVPFKGLGTEWHRNFTTRITAWSLWASCPIYTGQVTYHSLTSSLHKAVNCWGLACRRSHVCQMLLICASIRLSLLVSYCQISNSAVAPWSEWRRSSSSKITDVGCFVYLSRHASGKQQRTDHSRASINTKKHQIRPHASSLFTSSNFTHFNSTMRQITWNEAQSTTHVILNEDMINKNLSAQLFINTN